MNGIKSPVYVKGKRCVQRNETKKKVRIRKGKTTASSRKAKQYIDSFTVHGLTRIFRGTKIESLIWLFLVGCGVCLCIFIIFGLVKKFTRYEVTSVVKYTATNKNYFPSIRICEFDLTRNAFFTFCGIKSTFSGVRNCSIQHKYKKANMSYVPGKYWSNGIFNVTKCFSWDGQNCISKNLFRSMVNYNNSCIDFNFNGTFFDIYSHIEVNFEFTPPKWSLRDEPEILLLPSDHRVHEIEQTRFIRLMPDKEYNVVMEKTFIKRLPHPYPSKCSENKTNDIFPGKYARRQCIESFTYKAIYKQCGAVFDYAKQFMDQDFIDKYKSKEKDTEKLRECINNFSQRKQEDHGDCVFPCDEVDYNMIANFYEKPNTKKRNDSVHRYLLGLSYRVVDTYKVLEETPRYTWDQMLSEIGGVLGLVIGASIMSIVEIFACLGMEFHYFLNKLLNPKDFKKKSTKNFDQNQNTPMMSFKNGNFHACKKDAVKSHVF